MIDTGYPSPTNANYLDANATLWGTVMNPTQPGRGADDSLTICHYTNVVQTNVNGATARITRIQDLKFQASAFYTMFLNWRRAPLSLHNVTSVNVIGNYFGPPLTNGNYVPGASNAVLSGPFHLAKDSGESAIVHFAFANRSECSTVAAMKTMLDEAGQIGIPQQIRDMDHLAPGDLFEMERLTPGRYLLRRQSLPAENERFNVVRADDGLPLIRVVQGHITSRLVKEIL